MPAAPVSMRQKLGPVLWRNVGTRVSVVKVAILVQLLIYMGVDALTVRPPIPAPHRSLAASSQARPAGPPEVGPKGTDYRHSQGRHLELNEHVT